MYTIFMILNIIIITFIHSTQCNNWTASLHHLPPVSEQYTMLIASTLSGKPLPWLELIVIAVRSVTWGMFKYLNLNNINLSIIFNNN